MRAVDSCTILLKRQNYTEQLSSGADISEYLCLLWKENVRDAGSLYEVHFVKQSRGETNAFISAYLAIFTIPTL